ncbi:MAG: glycosyltransferase family 39 protein [Desulfobacterales bacterium]
MIKPSTQAALNITLIIFLLALISSITILSYVPPVSKDALTHHLAVPKLYLNHGGIYEIPSLEFSYYPMNIDLLYMIPLYLGNDNLAKYIHFTFALLTGWLIFDYLKRRINNLSALFGALLFLSIPIIVKLSVTVYVDLSLVFFSTTSILFLLKWAEKDFQLKYLIISALSCGFALGTKYNGLIVLFLLTLFIPFIYSRYFQNSTRSQYRAIYYGAFFLFISLLLFSPWLIKNFIWTNNPLYPLFDNWFNPTNVDSINSIGPFAQRRMLYQESLWETLLIPLRIFFQGQDNNPRYFDGKLNPFLVILPFFAFYGRKDDSPELQREKKVLLAFASLFLLLTFFMRDMRIRYIAPIIPPLVILSVFGLYKICRFGKKEYYKAGGKIRIGIVFMLVCFILFLNIRYIAEQFRYIAPLSYISGRVGRNEYIEKYRPEYAAMQYANKNLSDNTRIFGIFLGNRGYYSDREIIFFNVKSFQKTIGNAFSAENLLMDFKKKGITHLIIGLNLFGKWVNINLDEKEKEVLGDFIRNHLHLLFSKGGYGLYKCL